MDSFEIKIDRSNLLFELSLITRRWRQVLDNELKASGLTDATWRPLLHLHLLGEGTRQKDLAQSLGIRGPSLVRLLDALLEKGLVGRREDDSDRRAKLLFLTPEGQFFVTRIQETILSLENELFGQFSEDDITQMKTMVKHLGSAINEIEFSQKQ